MDFRDCLSVIKNVQWTLRMAEWAGDIGLGVTGCTVSGHSIRANRHWVQLGWRTAFPSELTASAMASQMDFAAANRNR